MNTDGLYPGQWRSADGPKGSVLFLNGATWHAAGAYPHVETGEDSPINPRIVGGMFINISY